MTTADTILLEQQNVTQVGTLLRDPHAFLVFSLSVPSVASFAAAYGWSVAHTYARLAAALRRLGARHVVDLRAARAVALEAAAEEFIAAKRMATTISASSPVPATTPPVVTPSQLPLLASACPGWVCYAEKTQPTAVPHLSRVKSPMAIMGTFLSRYFHTDRGDAPNTSSTAPPPTRVVHVAVMPCYDKKLEAARPELTTKRSGDDYPSDSPSPLRPETELVLTTGELHDLLRTESGTLLSPEEPGPGPGSSWMARLGVEEVTVADLGESGSVDEALSCVSRRAFVSPQPTAPISTPPPCATGGTWSGSGRGIGSGGFLDYIYRAAARSLYGLEVSDPQPQQGEVVGRGAGRAGGSSGGGDFRDVILRDPTTGKELLRFAYAYGFKNIQGVVRRLKQRGKRVGVGSQGSYPPPNYDYVEVMACPSGCLNGGGQLKHSVDVSGSSALSTAPVTRARLDELDVVFGEGEGLDVVEDGLEVTGRTRVAGEVLVGVLSHPHDIMTSFTTRVPTVGATISDW